MNHQPRRLLPFLILLTTTTAFAQQTRPTTLPASAAHYTLNPAIPTLWIIGDSTVRNGSRDDGNNGQWGWGHPIKSFFDTTKINVVNFALGGTSSRSYQNGPLWPHALADMKPGDYLIMQFGHNDGGSGNVTRGQSLPGNGDDTKDVVNPITQQTETVHTYGWYIRKYISDAKAKGAVCEIVCSLIPRNHWQDGKIIRTTNFRDWAQQAAGQAGVPFIDLNEIIATKYDVLGEDYVTYTYFPDKETVHTDWAGAILNAQTVVDGIKGIKDCDLSKYLLPNPPTDFPLPSGKAR
ncbi:MAG: rhamnogalacturonan acetylesterase [Tepidisphaeraceae bacterium]|jgi:lysophospholipase L1-like esterase